jgi:hypothetical protein
MGRARQRLKAELTEGSIRVTLADKVLTITSGANPPDAEEIADFVVHLDDILHWDAPHDTEEVEIDDLQRIVELIEAEFGKRGLTVVFE